MVHCAADDDAVAVCGDRGRPVKEEKALTLEPVASTNKAPNSVADFIILQTTFAKRNPGICYICTCVCVCDGLTHNCFCRQRKKIFVSRGGGKAVTSERMPPMSDTYLRIRDNISYFYIAMVICMYQGVMIRWVCRRRSDV